MSRRARHHRWIAGIELLPCRRSFLCIAMAFLPDFF
jgi:hypothetical protein